MSKFSLGLMSGTSADGLTVCAVQIRPFKVLHFKNYAYPKTLQQKLLTAFALRAPELSQLHFELGRLYARTVLRFLKEFHLSARDLLVMGSHGQTIYHGPGDAIPNTLQIGEPAFLAAATGRPVVSDFRPKDMALGGQGAPLIPFFDEYIWGQKSPKILLNIGGISNFSVVGKNIPSFGFDAGPGNTLIDLACQQQLHRPFDQNGRNAAKGTPDKKRIQKLLRQKFFLQKPPKSLDKNDFGEKYLNRYFPASDFKTAADRLATLTWFTAAAVAQAINDFVPSRCQKELVVSGGGSYNRTLLAYLNELLPQVKITTTLSYGIDPQAKESAAFALLGWLAWRHKINHCARATGAARNAILGKITL